MATKTKKIQQPAAAGYAVAVTRILLSFVFLWAFLDKLFGLGFATAANHSWLHGVSPTAGFLKSVHGPCAGMFHSMAGTGWADWLFMLGLLGLGVALLTGCALRIAAVGGTVLLVLLWAASQPLANNPVIDEHLIYLPLLWVVALMPPQLSLAGYWRSLPVVRANPWLW